MELLTNVGNEFADGNYVPLMVAVFVIAFVAMLAGTGVGLLIKRVERGPRD